MTSFILPAIGLKAVAPILGPVLEGVSLVSTVLGGIGQISQSRSQARTLEYNAAIASRDAEQARLIAAADERRIRRENLRLMGSAAARRGGSGVAFEGTVLDVFADEAAEAELRALDARYGGLLEARQLEQQSGLFRAEARNRRREGTFAAVGTILGGGLDLAGRSLLGGGRSLGSGSRGASRVPRTGGLYD